MARIYMPKSRIGIDGPLVFLAGPIRDAPHWQNEAIGNLLAENIRISIATPTRSIAPEYAPLVMHGHETYSRQREWECERLEQAALGNHGGAILFWLPKNAEHHCEKAYGAISRVEYGEWLIWKKFDPRARIVLGTDSEFSEIDTMLYDLQRYVPDLPVHSTLEEACSAALKLI